MDLSWSDVLVYYQNYNETATVAATAAIITTFTF